LSLYFRFVALNSLCNKANESENRSLLRFALSKKSKANQSEQRKKIETQSEATRFASLRFVAFENFALRIYMPEQKCFGKSRRPAF